MSSQNPVDLILSSVKCSQSELARAVGVTPAVISMWRKRGNIPTKRVKVVSEVTGIAPFVLCPEFFPCPTISAVANQQAVKAAE